MATSLRRKAINIIEDIVENGEEYDFYQAVRLLKRLSSNAGSDSDAEIRIRPELNLDYPNADISEINSLDDNQFEIITTFFGLYGVSSPLPGFYTEELLDDEWDEREAARGFFDVIHNHMYPLLFQAWLKYKFSHNAVEEGDPKYWEIIYSLLGLNEEFRANKRLTGRLLKYAGIISQQPKTMLGLKTILNDFIEDASIEIHPCVSRKVSIVQHQRCNLGINNYQLGEDLVVGQEVEDRSGKFLIEVGPVNTDMLNRITTDGSMLDDIHEIISLFLTQPFEYEIVLLIAPGTEQSIQLGNEASSRLAQNTWLINESNTEEFRLVLHS